MFFSHETLKALESTQAPSAIACLIRDVPQRGRYMTRRERARLIETGAYCPVLTWIDHGGRLYRHRGGGLATLDMRAGW